MANDSHHGNEASEQLSLKGEPLPFFSEAVNDPIGTTPKLRAKSIRRTMSIDARWPSGIDGPTQYLGRCRDVFNNTASSDLEILDQATVDVVCNGREIRKIAATPVPPLLQDLVGVRAGGHMRSVLASTLAEEKQTGSPLYLLLDDLAGTTLVARWCFSQWPESDPTYSTAGVPPRNMEGVCIGFRRGASGLAPSGRVKPSQNTSRVVPLTNPAEPSGWHEFADFHGINFRRARRIDIWREGERLRVESHFQDSASSPNGETRIAIHEYLLEAQIDLQGRLASVAARPGTLPFPECRAAPTNLHALIGIPASELREVVLEKLSLKHGCTHLNDMMRSLAEVPVLEKFLLK
ncbi:MAG: DUF2889 domain-containing protein [Qipengyuania pacifica]